MGVTVLLTLLFLIFISTPIALTLAIAGGLGLFILSPDLLVALPQKMFLGLNSFVLLSIPLFIFAGSIMANGGIARRIINVFNVFVGQLPGGLGMVSIISTMFFSGVSGSSTANTAAIGSVVLPEMKRNGYPVDFSTVLVLSAGATSTLIPPSIDLIIMGVVANISIGGLFAAGFIPGALNALALCILCYYFAKKLNIAKAPKLTFQKKIQVLKDGILAMIMPLIILGGILGGVFTPTEASAIAVVYGFIVSFFIYKEIKLKNLPSILLHTCKLSGQVLIILSATGILSFVLAYNQIPQKIADFIITYASNWIIFVLFVNILFLFLGMIMDALPAIIILLPILVRAGVALGMEPIHIAILVEANVAIGMITPPVGMCLFVGCSLSNIPIESVMKKLIPFFVALLITLLIISYFPYITMFIPRLLGYA